MAEETTITVAVVVVVEVEETTIIVVVEEVIDGITAAEVEELPAALSERYAGIADRLSLYTPFSPVEGMDFWEKFVEAW